MDDMVISQSANNLNAHYSKEYNALVNYYQNAKDKQGAIGDLWNGIKDLTGVGISENKCDSMLEKYKNGQINFEEAVKYIEKFDKKQNDSTDLIANILTGTASIATTTIMGVMGGPLLPILALGAGVGAVTKTALKLFDRATNDVKNDEFDVKTITKDVISGAVTGATSAVPSGIAQGIKTGNKALAIQNGIKCGAVCGASAGAISYTTDVVLDNKEFNFGELAKSVGTSAFVSGTVGAGVGAGLYGIANAKGIVGKEVSKTLGQTIASDSASSSARKVLAKAERNIIAA